MAPLRKSFLPQIAAAVASGILLRYVLDLHPVWWLVWLAPVPLLLMAILFSPRAASWTVVLAAIIGASANFHFYSLLMPLPAVLISTAEQTLLWTFIVLASRRLILRYHSWWTVFVYPVLWVTADTLLAAFLPDGNWGSLAYSQSDQLPILQLASIFGTAGILFLISLVPSALAIAMACGRSLRLGSIAYALTAILLVASFAYGNLRLQSPISGVQTKFGIVSIDDPIGPWSSQSYMSNILQRYGQLVQTVAAQGAQIVVLPEKIAVITPPNAPQMQEQFTVLARQSHIWLEVGIGIDDGKAPLNYEWLFAPDGALVSSYLKHHMAPPERRSHYAVGTDYNLYSIGNQPYGLAICKDMHFASLGLAYGQRNASVMLVPAWDFDYLDDWLEARTTIFRGVENGYTIVRASREGMLTVSDPFGRVLAERRSDSMPGATLIATAAIANPISTFYTRIGYLFGWLCVVAAVLLLLINLSPIVRDSNPDLI